jgi:hypothetical protein
MPETRTGTSDAATDCMADDVSKRAGRSAHRGRAAAAALVALLAVSTAGARSRFVCPQGEVIDVAYPADHRGGPDLIVLRRNGQSWRLREASDPSQSDRLVWRGNWGDAGADASMVWMETGDRGVLLRNGTVAVGSCVRAADSAAAPAAPAEPPPPRDPKRGPAESAEPPPLPDRATLERSASCYRQARLFTGYRHEGGRWGWHGWDEGRGRYRIEVESADAGTFRVLTPDLAVDAGAVYVMGLRRSDIDRATFRWLGGAHFADRRRVFFDCGSMLRLPGADPASFEPLLFPWGRDRRGCYFQHSAVKGCLAEGLRPFNDRYAHDGRRVYFGTVAVPDADPGSFRTDSRDPGVARDSTRSYHYGRPTESK